MKYVFDLKKVVLGVTDFLPVIWPGIWDTHPVLTCATDIPSEMSLTGCIFRCREFCILLHNHNAPPLEHGVLE